MTSPRPREGTKRRRRLLARLIGLNMLGLIVLAGGFLVLSESRQFLTNAYKQSLEAQARIVAGALSQTVINRNFQFFDPSLFGPMIGGRNGPDWEIREATKIMRRVTSTTNARIRLYGRDGSLVLDSANMDRSINVISRELPPLPGTSGRQDWPKRIMAALRGLFQAEKPILTEVNAAEGYNLPEVVSAIKGRAASLQRQNPDGADILTVAVPVQGYRAIIGALMVSTRPGEIDAIISAERRVVIELALIALLVSLLTSLLLASTITEPVRKLAGAMRVFNRTSPTLPGPDTIPDLSRRGDEIGDLSVALREMTEQLLERINTIDRFAADVAHELKNPLTSLHSAVQSLETTTSPEQQAEMKRIIQNDVQRLNRLISDISNATRLDAELNRGETEPFDLAELVHEMGAGLAPSIKEASDITLITSADQPAPVMAQKPRIAQIIDNLVSNAVSFTQKNGKVYLRVLVGADEIRLVVADEGPGIAAEMTERIFERFYSDRSGAAAPPSAHCLPAGGHSGLGLSISRQIARAHGGELVADNRPDGVGAYFTLILPREGRASA